MNTTSKLGVPSNLNYNHHPDKSTGAVRRTKNKHLLTMPLLFLFACCLPFECLVAMHERCAKLQRRSALAGCN